MTLAVVSTFGIIGNFQAARWNLFRAALAERGVELFLLPTTLHPGMSVPHVQIPYAFREFNSLCVTEIDFPGLSDLVALEEGWIRDPHAPSAALGARKARSFYETLFAILQPDVVCVWNTLCAHSRMVQLLCEERDIPNMTIEGGMLPHTMMLERGRISSGSVMNDSFSHSSFVRTYRTNHDLLARYRQFYAENIPVRSDGTVEQLEDQRRALARVDRPLCVILVPVRGAAAYPRENPAARRNFPGVSGFGEVIERVHKALPSMQVAFRDHPINRREGHVQDIPDGVIRLDRGTLNEALERAELVVACGSTNSLFEALVMKKNLLVVGRTGVDDFEPYHQCVDGDIEGAIQRALTGGYAAISRNADRALSFLLEHALFGELPTVPAGHHYPEVADFLARYDLDCPVPLPERYQALNDWVQTL